MRPKLNPFMSESVSQVILSINVGNDYLQQISRNLGKTSGSVSQQITTLDKYNLIDIKERINRKIITLNWEEIIKNIVINIILPIDSARPPDIENQYLESLKGYSTSKKAQDFFKELFLIFYKNGNDKTIYSHFLNLLDTDTFSNLKNEEIDDDLLGLFLIFKDIEHIGEKQMELKKDFIKMYNKKFKIKSNS